MEMWLRVASGRRLDYSIRRPVDRKGPDNRAAACDWSSPEAWSGDYRRAVKYGARVRAAFNRRDSRLSGWREFLGQTDTDNLVAGLAGSRRGARRPDHPGRDQPGRRVRGEALARPDLPTSHR
ncbi:hypothetical protein [Plantactinospora sp. KLBMP9567]|uniref:hypothetical protein n=1 Tax=Plantactinospora sp. KLBMP9567 TaxID=3085900 RepID=UPI002980D6A5|nr:hypothetical protein [Plantactinospora sp. KLBMP9567]MDW5323891.1 hypothetical protein [Plantactinospora sp. KLBMP9567]